VSVGAVLATYANVMAAQYLPAIRLTIRRHNKLMNVIQSMTGSEYYGDGQHLDNTSGRLIFQTQLGADVGWRSETGVMPKGAVPKYQEATFPIQYLFGSIQLSHVSVLATASGKDTRPSEIKVKALADMLDNLENKMKWEHERMIWGFQALATCGVTAASLTVNLTGPKWDWLMPGIRIDIINSGTGLAEVNGIARTVESIDRVNNRIVLDTAGGVVTTTAVDTIHRFDSYGHEPAGILQLMTANGIFMNINPLVATWEFWQPFNIDKSLAPVQPTELELLTWLEQLYENGGVGDSDDNSEEEDKGSLLLLTDPGVHLRYAQNYFALRKYAPESKEIYTGFKGIAIETPNKGYGATLVSHANVPHTATYGRIWAIRPQRLGVWELGDTDWLTSFAEGGGSPSPWSQITGTDGAGTVGPTAQYQATMYRYVTFGGTVRRAHGEYNGLVRINV